MGTGHTAIRKKPVDELYCPVCGDVALAANDPSGLKQSIAGLKKVADQLVKSIFEKEITPGQVHAPSVAITAKAYMDAVDSHLSAFKQEYGGPSENYLLYQALEENCYRFSAAKNYQEVLVLSRMLTDGTGNIRSFEDFRQEAARALDTFRGDWLRTEYDQALVTSQRVADYRRHVQNGDIYPTWQYKTRADGHVRKAHAALHNHKMAANDPAWRFIYPPNGWRCRCYIKPLGEDPPPPAAGDDAISALKSEVDKKGRSEFDKMNAQGFASNSAIDGTIFPKKHPYWQNVPEEVLRKASLMAPENFRRVHTSEKGAGWVDVHPAHGKKELAGNLAIARILADEYGEQVRLMPIDNTHKVKNPDAMIMTRNNELWDFKEPITTSVSNQIFNSIKQAKRQKCENVLIKISTKNATEIMNGFFDVGYQRFGSIKKIELMYQKKLIDLDMSFFKEKRHNEIIHYLDTNL